MGRLPHGNGVPWLQKKWLQPKLNRSSGVSTNRSTVRTPPAPAHPGNPVAQDSHELLDFLARPGLAVGDVGASTAGWRP